MTFFLPAPSSLLKLPKASFTEDTIYFSTCLMELKIPIHFYTETEFDMAMRAVMVGSELFDSHWQVITYLQQDLSNCSCYDRFSPYLYCLPLFQLILFDHAESESDNRQLYDSVIWLQLPGLFIFTTLLEFCNLSRKKIAVSSMRKAIPEGL